MYIRVPQLEESGISREDMLKYFILLSRLIVSNARKLFPSNSISDTNGYALGIYAKILTQAETLSSIIEQRKDYNTACALVRMLADNMCIVKLIYGEDNQDEKQLRHYLYILDGVRQRKEELERPRSPYNGAIARDDYEALIHQMESALENAKKAIHLCESSIRSLSLYGLNAGYIEKLITGNLWNYDSIGKYSKNKPSKINWQSLYKRVALKEPEMYSYLSQYVHGLAISNIVSEDEDDFDAVSGFTLSLVHELFSLLKKDYRFVTKLFSEQDFNKMLYNIPNSILDYFLSKEPEQTKPYHHKK